MTIWEIKDFSGADSPHWDVAYVEAATAAEALAAVADAIRSDKYATVWGGGPDAKLDTSTWAVRAAPRPLLFVLGGGCR